MDLVDTVTEQTVTVQTSPFYFIRITDNYENESPTSVLFKLDVL